MRIDMDLATNDDWGRRRAAHHAAQRPRYLAPPGAQAATSCAQAAVCSEAASFLELPVQDGRMALT